MILRNIVDYGWLLKPTSELGWTKPFYIEYGGKMVACRFKRWIYGHQEVVANVVMANGVEFEARMNYVIHHRDDCKKAFVDYLYVISSTDVEKDEFHRLILTDDKMAKCKFYVKDRENNAIEIPCDRINVKEWIRWFIQDVDFKFYAADKNVPSYAVRWYWDGVKACESYIFVEELAYTHKDGVVLNGVRLYVRNGASASSIYSKLNPKYKTYATKGECEEDNEVEVLDFDDWEDEREEDEESIVAIVLPKAKADAFIALQTALGLEVHVLK